MRVGLFDSGVGGLTVLNAFLKYHPNNEYFYYGDTLNMPYGDKTIDELYSYVKVILNYMREKKVDIIVIACGTISANLYDVLKKEVEVPIYSVISELPRYIEEKGYKNTLVLATNATINSHVFKNRLNSNVIEVACPKLVPIIEQNRMEDLDSALDEYIKDTSNIDSLILGCTHYGIIKEDIKRKIGKDIDIIDLGEILASKIELNDSFQSVDLHFSKVTNELEENVKKIINVV